MYATGSRLLAAKLAIKREIDENLYDLQRVAADFASSAGTDGAAPDAAAAEPAELDSLAYDGSYYRVFSAVRLAALAEEFARHNTAVAARRQSAQEAAAAAGGRRKRSRREAEEEEAEEQPYTLAALMAAHRAPFSRLIVSDQERRRFFAPSQRRWETRGGRQAPQGDAGAEEGGGEEVDTDFASGGVNDDRLLARVLGLPGDTQAVIPWLRVAVRTVTDAAAVAAAASNDTQAKTATDDDDAARPPGTDAADGPRGGGQGILGAGDDAQRGPSPAEDAHRRTERRSHASRPRFRRGGPASGAAAAPSTTPRSRHGPQQQQQHRALADRYWRRVCDTMAAAQEFGPAVCGGPLPAELAEMVEGVRRAASGAQLAGVLDGENHASVVAASQAPLAAAGPAASMGDRFLQLLLAARDDTVGCAPDALTAAAGGGGATAAEKEQQLVDAYVRRVLSIQRRNRGQLPSPLSSAASASRLLGGPASASTALVAHGHGHSGTGALAAVGAGPVRRLSPTEEREEARRVMEEMRAVMDRRKKFHRER